MLGGRGDLEKRSIVLDVGGEDLEEFLEYVEKKLEGLNYSYRYSYGSGLKVTFVGTKEENKEAEELLRRSYRNFMIVRSPVGGMYRYPTDWLMEHGGGVSFSLLTLSIKGAGLTARWSGDLLYTELDPKEMIGLLEELRGLIEEIKYEVRQKKAREVIVAAAVNTGVSPLVVLDIAEEEGILERDDAGVWWFRIDPDLALNKLIMRASELEDGE